VQDLAIFVFTDFKDYRIQAVSYQADGHILLANVRPLIEPIRPGEQLPHLLDPMPRRGFAFRRLLFRGSKLKRI
jgi:hypothetical protein